MVDIVYLVIALIFFLACWGLLVLCERLMEE
jgi:hypothetical protein